MKLFDEIPRLEDDYIILKKMTENDAEVLSEMQNDEAVMRYLPTFLFENQIEDKKEAIRQMYEGPFNRKESLFLGIYLKEKEDSFAGIAEFYNYDPNWNKVSIGYRLSRPFWNKGIAKHTIALMRRYLFECTDVKRITAHVMVQNIYSARSLQRLGFRLRKSEVPEDWGFEHPVIVNKYVIEKLGSIKYVKIGSGPKVMVILPGLAFKSTLGSADLLAASYEELFKDYSIYLFDDRSNIGEGYSIRERAGDVAAEMHTLGIRDACVFGVSMGGMTAQYLAIDHPGLVKKMVLTSTAPYMADAEKRVVSDWRALAVERKKEELISLMIEDIYSPKTVKKFGKLLRSAIGCVSDRELDEFILLTGAILEFNCYNELDKIKCPVLVIGAEGDKILSREALGALPEKLGCEFFLYGKEYGHAVYDEARDHRKRILEFFERS